MDLCCRSRFLIRVFLPSSGSPFLGLLVVRSSWRRLADTRVSERRRESKVEGGSISASALQLPFLIEKIAAPAEKEEIDDNDDEYYNND